MRANNGTQDLTKPQGFIALHRATREHWIWQDPVKFQWWVDILMECNYTDRKVNIGGKLIECNRGESLNSLKTWAKRWMVDMGKVRRFFKLLEDDGMIIIENAVKTTRLKVCNYDTYNKPQHANDTHSTRSRHANDTHSTSNNKGNKDNKGEKVPAPPVYGSASEPKIPTEEDVRLAFHQNGGNDEMAAKFYSKHTATGWYLNNTAIRNFATLVPTFITNYKKIESGQVAKPAVFSFNKEDKNSYV